MSERKQREILLREAANRQCLILPNSAVIPEI